jgi:hypothetical protein
MMYRVSNMENRTGLFSGFMGVSREFYAGLGMRDSERYDGEMVNR